MLKRIIVLFIPIVFVYLYFPIALPHGQPTTGYSMVPDAEADYLITKSIAEGGGLYQDFSILYPPGRFFLQALLFKLVSPSAVVSSVLRIALSLVIFPALFFLLAEAIFSALLKNLRLRYKEILPVMLAFLATALYLAFIRSAQEIHVLAGLFFLSLLWADRFTRSRLIFTGMCFGLVTLFRLDAGILLGLSLVLTQGIQSMQRKRNYPVLAIPFITGIAVIWIPTLLAILVHGSIFHFFYDIVVLGIFVQPKLMGLPIPENELGLVFLSSLIFLVGSGIALFREAEEITVEPTRIGLQTFAVFGVVSYVSALGRSDEPHLWYGLVWLTIPLIFVGIRMLQSIRLRERPNLISMMSTALIIALFSWGTLQVKSPGIFLISCLLLFFLAIKRKIHIFSLLIVTILLSLSVFHSVSYLQLRFSLPKPPARSAFSPDWVTTEGQEVGGILMQDQSKKILDIIRADIPTSEHYLFVFPTNVLLGEYLGLTNPTRYIILGAERTDRTEDEIIADLHRTQTKYFLVFDQKAKDRNGKLWDWILTHTRPINEYRFPPDFEIAHLRLRTE